MCTSITLVAGSVNLGYVVSAIACAIGLYIVVWRFISKPSKQQIISRQIHEPGFRCPGGRTVGWLRRLFHTTPHSLDDLNRHSCLVQSAAFWYFDMRQSRWAAHVSHPDDIADVLSATQKGAAYTDVSSFLGCHGLLTLPAANQEYCAQRRKMQRSFAPHCIRDMAAVFGKYASMLRDQWLAQTANGCTVTTVLHYDVAEVLVAALCEVAGFTTPHATSLRDVASAFRRAAALRSNQSSLNLLGCRTVHSTTQENANQIIDKFAEFIAANSSIPLDSATLWARIYESACLLDVESRASAEKHERLKDHIKTFLFAGFETTMNSLLWGILLLSQQKEFQEELAAEINGALPSLRHKNSTDRSAIDASDLEVLRGLPLLRAFLKETLRLFPPAPVVFRTVGAQDLSIRHSDVIIPPGSLVAINIFAMQRCPTVFLDPAHFQPRRWLRNDDAGDAEGQHDPSGEMDRHMAPFSAGARSCLGRDMAMTELMIFFATLLSDIAFDPLTRSTDGPTAESMKAFHVTLSPEIDGQPIRLRISQRL